MRLNWKLATVLAAASALSATALAQMHGPGDHEPPHPPKTLEELDRNGDGQVTRSEVLEDRKADFAEADTNGDGLISFDEAKAQGEARRQEMMERRARARFDRIDTDGDGAISIAEIEAQGTPMFDRVDKNGDGVIEQSEIEDMGHRRSGRFGHRGER